MQTEIEDENFEGPRCFRLKGAVNQTLDKVIQELSWEKFLSCFPIEFQEENKKLIYESYTTAFFNIFRENVKVSFNFQIKKKIFKFKIE